MIITNGHLFLLGIIGVCVLLWQIRGGSRERYMQGGACDCCKCGWQSCKTCAENRKACCGSSMGFDRYTFEPTDDKYAIDPLYPLVRHVKNKV